MADEINAILYGGWASPFGEDIPRPFVTAPRCNAADELSGAAIGEASFGQLQDGLNAVRITVLDVSRKPRL